MKPYIKVLVCFVVQWVHISIQSGSMIETAIKTQTLNTKNTIFNDSGHWLSPADLRTACNLDTPVALLDVETLTGTNLSFQMVIKLEMEEQIPSSLNCPLLSVVAWVTLGWLARATLAPAMGDPVTLWTSPYSLWPSQTQTLQSSLGRPSVQTRWHFAVCQVTYMSVRHQTKMSRKKLLNAVRVSIPGHGFFPHFWTSTDRPLQ